MFTVITEEAFNELQVDAGVLLNNFDPTNPQVPTAADIITATTGGITVACTPTYSDWGEDVDNCPANMKELKHLDGWDCKMSTTAIGTSAEVIRLSLGAADVTVSSGKIEPRRKLKQTDFNDELWWVGDRSDGGLVAIQLKNALSTGGFSLKTTKNGKGQLTLELTGHVSILAQDVVPMVFYSLDTEGAGNLGSLTVASVASSTAGKTDITVSGRALKTGESYVYKLGTAAQTVARDDVLTSWTDWDGDDPISATSGQVITVAAVDASDKAQAAGSAVVHASAAS